MHSGFIINRLAMSNDIEIIRVISQNCRENSRETKKLK